MSKDFKTNKQKAIQVISGVIDKYCDEYEKKTWKYIRSILNQSNSGDTLKCLRCEKDMSIAHYCSNETCSSNTNR
jgi:hypothetical protein